VTEAPLSTKNKEDQRWFVIKELEYINDEDQKPVTIENHDFKVSII
jgi:hypothetical protein